MSARPPERILFDRPLGVHYGFVRVYPEAELPEGDLGVEFRGQTNGLLGAGHPGQLFAVAGLHTGHINVRVVLRLDAPALGDWEDIVEASFTSGHSPLWFAAFDDGEEIDLPVGSYRARWSASGMDTDHVFDSPAYGTPAPGRYELCLWPEADARPDEILRVSSAAARYWHSEWGAGEPD